MTAGEVTLFVGPATRLGLAVNAVVRSGRAAMATAGLRALPTRTATPVSRALALDEAPPATRLASFRAALGAEGPAFLAALNFLGAPATAVSKRELFPDMAALFLGLSRLDGLAPRIVMAIEPLHVFFVTVESDALARRVSATPWEALYDISWADLVRDIHAALPGSELLVMTPEAGLYRGQALTTALFGEAGAGVDPGAFARAHLSAEGQAALAELTEQDAGGDSLRDIEARFGTGVAPRYLEERFGIDPVTATLLEQRFAEDVSEIAAIPGVRLL